MLVSKRKMVYLIFKIQARRLKRNSRGKDLDSKKIGGLKKLVRETYLCFQKVVRYSVRWRTASEI